MLRHTLAAPAFTAWPEKPPRTVVTFAARSTIGGAEVVRPAPNLVVKQVADRAPAVKAADVKN